MSATSAVEKGVQDLYTKGYTVFERVWSDAEVEMLRGRLVARWQELGKPALYVIPPVSLAEDVMTGPAGLTLRRLALREPDLVPLLYKPQVIETLRRFLGPRMRLELVAGAISDKTRPFFDWHVHIDGVDDAYYDYKRPYPIYSKPERVVHLLYLDDIGDETGELLVLPRKIDDPTPPPYNQTLEEWPGQVEVRCPRGSVVLLEQCTWHAVRRMRGNGVRCFIGSYFIADGVKMAPIADGELANWDGEDELFRSLVRP